MRNLISYFGNKYTIAPVVWEAFGECVYHDPFFGTGSVFFNRPSYLHKKMNNSDINTACDRNFFLVNFIRSIKFSSEEFYEIWSDIFPNSLDVLCIHNRLSDWANSVNFELFAHDDTFHDVFIGVYYMVLINSNIGLSDIDFYKKIEYDKKISRRFISHMKIFDRMEAGNDFMSILTHMTERLKTLIVCYGDYKRSISKGYLNRSPGEKIHAIFMDPPYHGYAKLYRCEEIAKDACKTLISCVNDGAMGIICDYNDTHDAELLPLGWTKFHWNSQKIYNDKNLDIKCKNKESIWISQNCNDVGKFTTSEYGSIIWSPYGEIKSNVLF